MRPTASLGEVSRRRALVVAADAYTNPVLRELAAPTTEAQALAAALADPAVGDFDTELELDQPSYVTRHRVESFLADGRPGDLMLLVVCGLGITDDRGALFVAGTDTRPEYVRTSALDAALIRRALTRCRARQAVLILDCRFGTAVRSGATPVIADTVDIPEQLGPPNMSGDQGRVLITASSAVDYVFEGDRLRDPAPAPSSAFTGALVERLTAVRADRHGGGRMLLDEWYDAARARMRVEEPARSSDTWKFGRVGDILIAGTPSLQGSPVPALSPPPPTPLSLRPPPPSPPPPPPRSGGAPAPPAPRSQPSRSARPATGARRRTAPRSSRPRSAASSSRRGLWIVVIVALVGALGLGYINARLSGAQQQPSPDGDDEAATEGPALAEHAFVSVALCEPFSLVPAQTTDTCGWEVLGALFSPLVDYDPASSRALWGSEAPHAVAESVESQDQQAWTITLKDGWTFHDGTAVTAQSYIDAWNYHAYGPNAAAWTSLFADIEGYEDLQCETDDTGTCEDNPVSDSLRGLTAVDDRTIEVRLVRPSSQFPLMLNALAFSPLPSSFYDDPVAYERSPVGNGPFQMSGDWNRGGDLWLARYDDYPAEPAAIGGIVFQIETDMDAAYEAIKDGGLDILAAVPTWLMRDATDDPDITYREGWTSVYHSLAFPPDDDRFADPDLRKAISMAIDREALVELAAPQHAPADGFFPPGIAGYQRDVCGDNCAYDPQRAKRLFDEAGGFDGTMTLWTTSGHEEWMEIVRDQLRDNLGLTDVEVQTWEFEEYLERLEGGDMTGPYRIGWFMDYPSPQNYLQHLLHTDGVANYSRWSNQRFDQLIDRGNAAPTIEDSLRFYAQAQDVAVSAMPSVPLLFEKAAVAHSDEVFNVRLSPTGRLNWAEISVAPRLSGGGS